MDKKDNRIRQYVSSCAIYREINSLSRETMETIMFNALSFMQQHNGRSRTDCIALALGYKIDNDGEGNNQYFKYVGKK